MAYTRTWDDTQPPDSAARNQVANFFRQLKQDVLERMNDQFAVDWTTDPVVPQAKILGNVTGKLLNLHWSEFSPFPIIFVSNPWAENRVSSAAQNNYLLNNNGSGSGNQYNVYGNIHLPDAVTITDMTFYVDPAGGSGNYYCAYKQAKSDGSTTALFAGFSSVASGYQVLPKSGLTEVIDNTNYFYFVVVTLGDGATKLYGVSVTYNVPDCRNTI